MRHPVRLSRTFVTKCPKYLKSPQTPFDTAWLDKYAPTP